MRFLLFLLLPLSLFAKGVHVNALKDPCWGKCVQFKWGKKPCISKEKVGMPASFFEPLFLIDVTEEPYRLVSLGGMQLLKPKKDPLYQANKKRGAMHVKSPGNQSGFMHAHFYIFPMAHLMSTVLNMELPKSPQEMLIPYLSELDLSWNEPKWSMLIDAESFLYANPIMQVACLGDCAATSMGKCLTPDPFFWCAGCSGSLYPLSGEVEHYNNSVQASWLLAQRVLAKLHKIGLLRAYPDDNPLTGPEYQAVLRKRNYRLQMLYPKNKHNCDIPGANTLSLAASSMKISERDFSYIVWRRRMTCLGIPYSP